MSNAADFRAVSIGVAKTAGRDALPFAHDHVHELAATLEQLGYRCVVHDADDLPSAEVGSAVRDGLAGTDVAIVHVLSHGKLTDDGGTVYVLGSDGEAHETADIGSWLAGVQHVKDRPLTLFLLDLCHGGHQARLPWHTRSDVTRGWVIAACEPDEAAFDGRFTRAVGNVLRRVAAGELDIDPALRYVPLPMVAREIRLEVNRLTGGGYAQQVTATRVDISDDPVELPFFPNPRFDDADQRPALRRSLDSALVPFLDDLDEGLDARHFLDRAAGTRMVDDGTITGCFTGRRDQLRTLTDWFNGYGPGPFQVLTGSPGVGKSALLGLLVCASHPRLREATEPLWRRVERVPYAVTTGLAAVHARRRTVAEVRASIARQLDVADLDALPGLPHQPVIVVDALDEADDGAALAAELLALARAVRQDGTPAVRLLVGSRRLERYGELFRAAEVTNLDDVDSKVLRVDLERYVNDLLWAVPDYSDRYAVRGGFAGAVAAALAGERGRPGGEFMMAGLYTRHFVASHDAAPVTDAKAAEEFGARAPRTVPDVLDLDLELRRDQIWLGLVLRTLAHAYGQGMPETVLARVCGAFVPVPGAPEIAQVRAALDAGSFYLRRDRDPVDGTILYRLFHQGLADHLRDRAVPEQDEPRPAAPVKRPVAGNVADALRRLGHIYGIEMEEDPSAESWRGGGGGILGRLLDPLGPPDALDWALAEPYLLRHALDHAREAGREAELLGDLGFLLHASPGILEPFLDESTVTALRATADQPIAVRQSVLALAIARQGRSPLLPAGSRAGWQPLWTRRRPAPAPPSLPNPAVRPQPRPLGGSPLTGHTGAVLTIATTTLNGRAIAVTGSRDNTVRMWDLTTRTQLGKPLTGHTSWVNAVATGELGDGRPIAVTGGGDGTVRVWDLTTRTQFGKRLAGHTSGVKALAVGRLDGRPIAVTGGSDLTVRVWDLTTRTQLGDPLTGHTSSIRALAIGELDGRPIAVTAGKDTTLRLWDLQTRTPIGGPLTGHTTKVNAVATGELDGRPIAVTAGTDGVVHVWDLERRTLIGPPLTGYAAPVYAAAIGMLEGRPIAVIGGDHGTVRVWDMTDRILIGDLLTRSADLVFSVAIGMLEDRPVAVCGSTDGKVRVCDLINDVSLGDSPTGDANAAGTVVIDTMEGRPAGATALHDGTVRSRGPGQRATGRSACLTLFPHGGRLSLMVIEADGSAWTADLPTGDSTTARTPPRDIASAVPVSIGGRDLVGLWLNDGTSRLWDTESHTLIDTESVPLRPPARRPIAVSGGRLVELSLAGKGGIRLVDPASREPLVPALQAHDGVVAATTVCELSGRPIAFTGGADGRVRTWDVTSWRPLDTLYIGDPVVELAATPDGYLIVATHREVIAFRHAVRDWEPK
ncbi:caspase family protein [Planotetraspora sp. GP83]|uniref:caspase family protein n=1 Tax=Planotetraspora sp. GP83 TaxID=3156264 RepID=UPI0035156EE7